MNQDGELIERLNPGLYCIKSSIPGQGKQIWVTAQNLRDLYDYALLHMSEIEHEAEKMNRRIEKRQKTQGKSS